MQSPRPTDRCRIRDATLADRRGVMSATVLQVLDATIVNVALPTIQGNSERTSTRAPGS